MSKRDIAFAHCSTYLLAWLIGEADPKRRHIMKEGLQTIHETLDKEDEATSEEGPKPHWLKDTVPLG